MTEKLAICFSALLLATAVACGGGNKESEKPTPSGVQATPSHAAAASDAASPAEPAQADAGTQGDAGVPEADPACVSKCVEQSQMRAEPMEKIRADCARQCAEMDRE